MSLNLKRFISLFLAAVMVLNVTPLTPPKAHAVSPETVNDAVGKFAEAAATFSTKFAEDSSKLANFFTTLGGVSSAAAGVIGILQMTGVIKDPTTEMLQEIIDILHDMQKTLAEINNKLDDIAKTLVDIQIEQKKISRATEARDMASYWRKFRKDYVEPMSYYMDEYDSKITQGIEAWWKQSSHDGVIVLVTPYGDRDVKQTYTLTKYNENIAVIPEKADNGDPVDQDWSFAIPGDFLPETSSMSFNIDTYRDDFKLEMVSKFQEAIILDRLLGGTAFHGFGYSTAPAVMKLLEQYADYVLNAVIYNIACDVMSNNDTWVTNVISAYKNYCSNVMEQDSGINAFLNYMFLTHGFEAEIKDDIKKFCDGMVFQAGYYGEFVLTCAGQDRLKSQAKMNEIQELFANTIIKLSNTKNKALIADNYCYVTGTIVEAAIVTAKSMLEVKVDDDGYKDYKSHSWEVEVPSIVNGVDIQVLYKQWQSVPNGASNFTDYLNKAGVGNGLSYVTNYIGQSEYDLDDGELMYADSFIYNANFFVTGKTYYINLRKQNKGRGGDPDRAEDEYFRVHDEVLCDLFVCETGQLHQRHRLGARALYGESHWKWDDDEAWTFRTGSIEYTHSGGGSFQIEGTLCWYKPTFKLPFWVLKSTPVHSMNGEDFFEDPANPFASHGLVSLNEGVSDHAAPHYINLSKDITELEIEGDSFVYAGKPVEPKVIAVKASDDVVPEDGYDVSYADNNEPGYAWVIVKGKGDYAGSVSAMFTITSDSDSPSSPSADDVNPSSGGCNAAGGVGIALAVMFVVKKLRRR